MSFRWKLALGLLLLLSVSSAQAQTAYSADTGECGEDTPSHVSASKTPVRVGKNASVKIYGKIEIRRNAPDAKQKHCHVVYHLMLSQRGGPFSEVKRLEWDWEDGEIAGIDLVSSSPSGLKVAADFWLAQGDGTLHRPVVYDLKNHTAADRPLEDLIQKRIQGCDQNEDFMGVTDIGEAIFAIPPSEYDDSPECGDKGIWHFNLQTGRVYRVKKISGIKWN